MPIINVMTLLLLGLGGLAVVVMVGFFLEQRFQQRLQQALKAQRDTFQEKEKQLQQAQQRLEAEQQDLRAARKALEADKYAEAHAVLTQDLQAQLDQEKAERLALHEAQLKQDQLRLGAEIIARSVQIQATSYTRERTKREIPLAPDDTQLRGRLIGKGGRNIQAFQQLTGVDMFVGDEGVVLSCFDPLKLELADRSLGILMKTQRISPENIKQVHQEQEQALAKELPRLASKAAHQAGLTEPLDDRLLQAMGRLNYRTSAGQNLLHHAQEVAQLAGIMAQEIGANETLARRGGFLHDLGKALPETPQSGTHSARGVALAERVGESEALVHIIAAHHREVEPQSPEAFLVQAADAISAARPGVRSEKNDWKGNRVERLEKLIQSFEGVEQVIVLKTGHEVMVMVDPDEMSEDESQILGHTIANAVRDAEPDLRVKLSVIREWKGSHYV